MNTPNNKRRQQSQEKIEKIFIELLQKKEITEITVSEICKAAEINRSTFYANYVDIYDLADRIRFKLEEEVANLYDNDIVNKVGGNYLKLFYHIKENQIFYSTYFKLGFDKYPFRNLGNLNQTSALFTFPSEHLDYHIEFHRAGLNAIIKKWLQGGCKEAPEEMVSIVESEYMHRSQKEKPSLKV